MFHTVQSFYTLSTAFLASRGPAFEGRVIIFQSYPDLNLKKIALSENLSDKLKSLTTLYKKNINKEKQHYITRIMNKNMKNIFLKSLYFT